MGYLFKRVSGHGGDVKIPFLGAHVGTITEWTLTRRGDGGPDAALYDLRAAFSFLSETLFNDEEYRDYRRITIRLGKTKHYRIEQAEGFKTTLAGKSLVMEGVRLWEVEREAL